MSTFAITIEVIEKTWPLQFTKDGVTQIAGNIELATLQGKDYQFVVHKGKLNAGDSCLYFPVDSVLPDALIKTLGLWDTVKDKSRLSGNRVRTVKLCQALSQGLVCSVDLLAAIPTSAPDQILSLAERLGVTKYEPPIVPCKTGHLHPLPPGVPHYDIESAQNYPDLLAILLEQEVVVCEKLEGQNFSVTFRREEGSFHVNQRSFSIKEIPGVEHSFWKLARELHLPETLKAISDSLEADVTLYGEFLGPGVQGNIYKLPHHTVRFFDCLVNRRFMDFDVFTGILASKTGVLESVPILFRGLLRDWLASRSVVATATGSSVLLSSQLREGIVIKPLKEQSCLEIGRVILKVRDPVYLEKTGE